MPRVALRSVRPLRVSSTAVETKEDSKGLEKLGIGDKKVKVVCRLGVNPQSARPFIFIGWRPFSAKNPVSTPIASGLLISFRTGADRSDRFA